jgi:hypothetical protein
MLLAMEKTRKQSKKTVRQAPEVIIKAAYQEHLLIEGRRPASVYKFCQDIGIPEDQFYSFYGSFDSVEKSIWNGYIQKTITRLQSDDAFAEFSAREKILSLYFTLLEELRANRSFVLLQLSTVKRLESTPLFLKDFRKSFEDLIIVILERGKESGEIATRPLLDERYPGLFWFHFGFILMFWKNDDSKEFEKTDAAIEKSVNLAFDLISKGAVDSALDFGKFLYQNR